jgi:hypothetical protein
MKYLKHNINHYSLVLLIISITVFTAIIIIYLLSGITLVPWFEKLPFADVITITGAVECIRAGMDPYIITSFDPWARPFIYPKLWLTIYDFLNLSRSSTNYIGIVLVYLFTIAASFIFEIKKNKHLIFVLVLFLSPTVLLLLERGNSDIIIFILVAIAVFYLRKIKFLNEPTKLHIAYIIILFVSMLKIYPIFLLPLLFFEKISNRNFIIISIYSTILILGYVGFTYLDLLHIQQTAPNSNGLVYGKNVAVQLLVTGKALLILSNSLMVLVFGVALYFRNKYKDQLNQLLPINNQVNDNIWLFLAGALIYAGTFFIGNNWDYRLVFLLFTIPYILDIFNQSKHRMIPVIVFIIFFTTFYGSVTGKLLFPKYWPLLKIISSWTMLFFIFLIFIHLFKNRKVIIGEI